MPRRIAFLILLLTCAGLLLGVVFSPPAQAGSIPESAYVPGFLGHAQTYSLSCESRSAADWAAFWGKSIDESEFLDRLPRSDNPDVGFVGDPNAAWGNIPPQGYGVHADPVAALLREYGFQAQARHGLSWDDLRSEIANGRPVIVWIIGQMWSGKGIQYSAADGDTSLVARFEHTMILIGYDASVVHMVDAYTGYSQTYLIDSFLASWQVLDNMAVTGSGDFAPPQAEEPTGSRYVVQSGDYLAELARRFGTSWQELARLNDLAYPYVIYPGQELILSEVEEGAQEEPPKAEAEANRFLLPLIFNSQGQPAVESSPTIPETYTVAHGDYLIDLARRFNIDWRTLADLNAIQYPFFIYPGQVLRLR